MKTILFFIASLPSLAFATAQSWDTLIYKGEPERISSTPLEGYFTSKNPRPTWLTMAGTASWSGYWATWELRDKRLFLKKVEREEFDKMKNDYIRVDITKRIFPEASPPIEATWFTGTIRMPQGMPIFLDKPGLPLGSEKEIFLEFENGILKKETTVVNRVAPTQGLPPLPPLPPFKTQTK